MLEASVQSLFQFQKVQSSIGAFVTYRIPLKVGGPRRKATPFVWAGKRVLGSGGGMRGVDYRQENGSGWPMPPSKDYLWQRRLARCGHIQSRGDGNSKRLDNGRTPPHRMAGGWSCRQKGESRSAGEKRRENKSQG